MGLRGDPAAARRGQCREAEQAFEVDELSQHGRDVTAAFGEGTHRKTATRFPVTPFSLTSRWRGSPTSGRLNSALAFPQTLDGLIEACAAAGQHRPTPLLLRYWAGGYNCLHQDLYGEVAFPLQVTIMLSAPDEDFTGGENVLVEQRPRAQSRPVVARLGRGEALLFPTRDRPVPGKRGPKRVAMRHGVSTVHTGERTTLGIIFHNAE